MKELGLLSVSAAVPVLQVERRGVWKAVQAKAPHQKESPEIEWAFRDFREPTLKRLTHEPDSPLFLFPSDTDAGRQ